MQAAVGNLPVTDVYLSPSTKKLLVRLADTCERSELKHILIGYQWHWVILCCHRVSGWLMHQYKCLRQKRQSDHFYFIFFLKPCILVFDMAVFKQYWLFIVLAFCHSIIRITVKRLFLKHYIHDLFSPRSALTCLKVDPVALLSSEKSGKVRGLIITMKGSLFCTMLLYSRPRKRPICGWHAAQEVEWLDW